MGNNNNNNNKVDNRGGRGWYLLNGKPRFLSFLEYRQRAERERVPYYCAQPLRNIWAVYRMDPVGPAALGGWEGKLLATCATREDAFREVNRLRGVFSYELRVNV